MALKLAVFSLRQGSGGVAIAGGRSRAAGFARHPGADTLGRPNAPIRPKVP